MDDNLVKCLCRNCNQGIEFAPADLAGADTRQINCPHCGLETTIFIPVQNQESAKNHSEKSGALLQAAKDVFSVPGSAMGRFERIVFGAVRMFTVFWAAIVVLGFILLTISYLLTFFPSPSSISAVPAPTIISQVTDHPFLESLAEYLLGLFVFFCILTIISISLILLAIERNTRKS